MADETQQTEQQTTDATTTGGKVVDQHKIVGDIIARRDEYRKYAKDNFYGELQEVWRGINCRTKKIMKVDSAGRETNVEDTARTNVAMPDLAIMYWRNLARTNAQPYRLDYTGGSDPFVADMFSSLTRKQYDRSNEVVQDVRVRMSSEAFGMGYSKVYEDTLSRTMKFRRAIMSGDGKVVFRDRQSIMRYQGAPDDEITGSVQANGADMSDDEITQFLQSDRGAKTITVPTEVTKYEGPCVKFVFPGSLFLEPRCLTLNESGTIIEQYQETDLWLKWMCNRTYKHPVTGKVMPMVDKQVAFEIMKANPDPKAQTDDLRSMFDASIGRDTDESYRFPTNLRVRKKFNFIEEHCLDDDGIMTVTWVCEDYKESPLGKMSYPWDLYGHSVYTEEVPLPDLMSAFGNSTPRLSRYLYQMHNRTVAQNFDYITNLIKKLFLRKEGTQISAEVVHGMFREMVVSDLAGIKPMEEPQLPAGSFEREQQIIRMLSMLDPAMAATDSGTTTNPLAGRTATSQLIASKISDAILQFKVNGRDLYIRELGQKKLWINQQAAEDSKPWEIEQKYWNNGVSQGVKALGEKPDPSSLPQWAMSGRFGVVSAVRLDPMEIQEDLDVEPEALSYMAVDDDLRRAAADRVAQIGLAAPDVVDIRKVVSFELGTIRGIGNPDDFIKPEVPPDPMAGVKVGLNITVPVKLEDLPADIRAQVLERAGIQLTPQSVQELQATDLTTGISKLSTAADAATNLLSRATPPEPQPGIGKKPPKK